MQAIEQKQNQAIFFEELNVEIIERSLFKHLETCSECCRSFDVRVRFRPAGRNRIY